MTAQRAIALRGLQRDLCALMYARRSALIRVWYPTPCARNQSRTSSSSRRVSCRLRGGAFNPRRTMARANISGVSSGFSDRSMSSSRSASKRFQSVIDCLEECFLLTACRFSRRDDSDPLAGLCMHNRDHPALNQSEGDEALFPVVGPRVLDCNRVAVKDCGAVGEVEPMLTDVCQPLLFIPFELNAHCSYILSLRKVDARLPRSQGCDCSFSASIARIGRQEWSTRLNVPRFPATLRRSANRRQLASSGHIEAKAGAERTSRTNLFPGRCSGLIGQTNCWRLPWPSQ